MVGIPCPGVRWSRKVENLHVTVKFLGSVPAAKVEALGAALTLEKFLDWPGTLPSRRRRRAEREPLGSRGET